MQRPKYLILSDSEIHGKPLHIYESTDFLSTHAEADGLATELIHQGERRAYIFRQVAVYEPDTDDAVEVVRVDVSLPAVADSEDEFRWGGTDD